MSEVTVEQLQDRIAALEKNVDWLTEAYKDVAYEYLNGLVKRIEIIRDEVNTSIRGVQEDLYAQTFEKITNAVEEARKNLSHEVITKSVIPALTDGSHVLVTRPASFDEHRRGIGVAVKQAPHRG